MKTKKKKVAKKKSKACCKDKIELALQEVKQLSLEAEDFFNTLKSQDFGEEKDGN